MSTARKSLRLARKPPSLSTSSSGAPTKPIIIFDYSNQRHGLVNEVAHSSLYQQGEGNESNPIVCTVSNQPRRYTKKMIAEEVLGKSKVHLQQPNEVVPICTSSRMKSKVLPNTSRETTAPTGPVLSSHPVSLDGTRPLRYTKSMIEVLGKRDKLVEQGNEVLTLSDSTTKRDVIANNKRKRIHDKPDDNKTFKKVKGSADGVGIGRKIEKSPRTEAEIRKKRKADKRPVVKQKPKVSKTKLPSLHIRSSPRPLCQAVKNINSPQEECLFEMGLSRLRHFSVDGIPTRLAYFVIDSFDPDSMTIRVQNRSIPVTIHRIHQVIGLPMGGREIDGVQDPDSSINIIDEWLKPYGRSNITAIDIMEHMFKASAADRQFKLDLIMLFCTTMIQCTKSRLINLKLLKSLNLGSDLANLNWCAFIFKRLKTCKKNWDINKGKPFTGPITILMLIYLEGLEIESLKQNKIVLPSSRWTLANMKVREEAEIKGGGFSRGKLVEISEEGYVTTIEEYKYMLDTLIKRVESYRTRYASYLLDAINDYPESDVWEGYHEKIKDMFTFVSTNGEVVKEDKAPDPTANIISKTAQEVSRHVENSANQVKVKDKELISQKHSSKKGIEASDGKDNRDVQESVKDIEKEDTISLFNDDFWSDPEVTAKIIEQMDSIEKKSDKKKTQVLTEGPSFSLGLTQMFDEVADAIEVDYIDNIPLSDCLQEMRMKTPLIRPKRKTTKAVLLKSPYVNRIVDVEHKSNIVEDKIWQFLFGAYVDQNKILFATKDGLKTDRESFESLEPDTCIINGVIDSWAAVLNSEEEPRSDEPPHILFCTTTVITKGMLEDGHMFDSQKLDIFCSNLLPILNNQADKLNLYGFDLVFFPVHHANHFFLICFNLSALAVVVLDNISQGNSTAELPDGSIAAVVENRDGSICTLIKDKTHVPIKYREILGSYPESVGHPSSTNIRNAKISRPELSWCTKKNFNDCGIFLMRHMETFKGITKNWVNVLDDEGRRQKTQLKRLRCKYAAQILLSEINIHREEVISAANRIWEEMLILKENARVKKLAASGAKKETRTSTVVGRPSKRKQRKAK